MGILLAIGAVLIIVIILLLVRAQTLVDVLKDSAHNPGGTSNKINAAMFPIFFVVSAVLLIWYSPKAAEFFLPESASVHGKEIDFIFWVTMVITGAAFVITHVLLFYFPFKYQFKQENKAHFYPDNNKLEVIWTVIPAIVLSLLVFSGWKVWSDITSKAPKEAMDIEIVGKQFNWMVRYPGKDTQLGGYNFRLIDATNQLGLDFSNPTNSFVYDDFMASEIHIPKGRPVQLRIRARDVLHSVFMPHFRVKMDAVPGMPTSFWFIADRTTDEMRTHLGKSEFNYELACTEVCGRGHFGMRMVIVVDEPEDFDTWNAAQASFLSKNPDYLAKVPDDMKSKAKLQIPIQAPSTSIADSSNSQAAVPNATNNANDVNALKPQKTSASL